jgi:hypothetical protein
MDAMLVPTFLCPKSWEGMSGHEVTRFCSYCKKHVHNLETMSISERLALLSSPAASICSRYKVAIRRPAEGKKESYMRHMLKYGAGVALTGTIILVLWEMHERESNRSWYRAASGGPEYSATGCEWPTDLYEEHEVILLGEIALPDETKTELNIRVPDRAKLEQVDLDLDPAVINQLLKEIKVPAPRKSGTTPLNID